MKFLVLLIALPVFSSAQSPSRYEPQENTVESPVSISVQSSAAVQKVGAAVTSGATGTYSDGSTRDITKTVAWTTDTPTVAVVDTRESQSSAICLAGGKTAVTAKSRSVSGSAPLTCEAVRAPGCGAGPWGTDIYDQSTCGNYSGAPYEDLTTSSSTSAPAPFGAGRVHQIVGGCPGVIVPTAGDVWRFNADINDGAGGTNQNCVHFVGKNGNNFVLDLAGFSLTGGIKCDQTMGGNDCSGITIVNGTINCNIANGGSVACISFNQGGTPSKSILLSHLTVNNTNSRLNRDGTYSGYEFAIYIQASGTRSTACPAGANQRTFNQACIEMAHLTVSNGFGYDGRGYGKQWCMRCTTIFIGGNGGVTSELWNNTIGNNAFVDAYQGIVFFHAGRGFAHNNYFPWVRYQAVGDTGRPILFDSAGKAFDEAGGEVSNNWIDGYNNRCVRTRQVNNILVHDNRFEHVESTTVDPCIMMGGNGDYAEKIDGNVVARNTFTQAGGTSIEAAESYGLTADSNVFLCDSHCATGILAASWIAEGSNGLTFAIQGATRTNDCKVTLNLAAGPSGTSVLAGAVFVNVSGRGDDFDVSATEGNKVSSVSGKTVSFTQANCSGASTGGPGGIFWMAQSRSDNFAANGAEMHVSRSIVDPLLTVKTPFVACGTAEPACQNIPQTNLNGGQTQMHYCQNPVPVGGTGALIEEDCKDAKANGAQ